MPDLTREEVERRLGETDYDLGGPTRWPEMHMEACRCSRCGRWLQIVRPGKYQGLSTETSKASETDAGGAGGDS